MIDEYVNLNIDFDEEKNKSLNMIQASSPRETKL